MKLKKSTSLTIKSDGGGYKTQVIDNESGVDIGYAISEADINIRADSLNTAKIKTIGVSVDIKAMLTDIDVICPYCGKNIEIDK